MSASGCLGFNSPAMCLWSLEIPSHSLKISHAVKCALCMSKVRTPQRRKPRQQLFLPGGCPLKVGSFNHNSQSESIRGGRDSGESLIQDAPAGDAGSEEGCGGRWDWMNFVFPSAVAVDSSPRDVIKWRVNYAHTDMPPAGTLASSGHMTHRDPEIPGWKGCNCS